MKHSISEYVNGMAHTNGIESFWALLKRGYHGTFTTSAKSTLTGMSANSRAAQHPPAGHHRHDGAHRGRNGWQTAAVSGLDQD